MQKYCRLTDEEVGCLTRRPEYQAAVVKAATECSNVGTGYYDCVFEPLLSYFYDANVVEELDASDPGKVIDAD